MNKKNLCTLIAFFATSHAFAAPHSKEPAASSSASSERAGLGFTTINIQGTTPSLSAWLDVNPTDSVQGFFGIATTSPFQFGVGGAYRHLLAGTQATGIHIGGGINLGTVAVAARAPFFFSIGPIAGLHFGLPGLKEIGASLDGAAAFQVTDGNFNFSLAGLSPAMGLSVHYFF